VPPLEVPPKPVEREMERQIFRKEEAYIGKGTYSFPLHHFFANDVERHARRGSGVSDTYALDEEMAAVP
jgi:hypothetical protein